MARRSELEVFGVSFVDLMCLAFIGQIIFWINRPPSGEPARLSSVLVTVEQYGAAHFDDSKDSVVLPARPKALESMLEVTSSTDPNRLIGKAGTNFKAERALGQAPIVMSYAQGARNGPAGTVTISFSELGDDRFEAWIPFRRNACTSEVSIHPIQIRSTTPDGNVVAAAVVHNSNLTSVTSASEWNRLARFLSASAENRGKLIGEILNKRFYIVDRSVGASSMSNQGSLWIALEISANGITNLRLFDDTVPEGSPTATLNGATPSIRTLLNELEIQKLHVIP